jgi:hypothetical protein
MINFRDSIRYKMELIFKSQQIFLKHCADYFTYFISSYTPVNFILLLCRHIFVEFNAEKGLGTQVGYHQNCSQFERKMLHLYI